MTLVFDTSAWVEYFTGTGKGLKIEKLCGKEKIVTPIIVLIELACKSFRENVDFTPQADFIKKVSIISNIEEDLIRDIASNYANVKRVNNKFSLADAIIITTSKKLNAILITCDYDFRSFSNVQLIN